MTRASWQGVRERAGGLLFALVLNGLLLLALLTLAPHPEQRQDDMRLPVTFDVAAGPEAKKEKAAAKEKEKAKERSEDKEREPPKPEKTPPVRLVETLPAPLVKLPSPLPSPLPFLVLESPQMAAADIGRMPRKAEAGSATGQGDQAAVAGPGEGPGGVQLFEAEWHRRPTHAELATYIPGHAPAQGWGLVACKTVDDYHVENCQALGESPAGSGFARAVRLAAWQFRVRPPRVNGKPMIGSWVRIRIDYSRSKPPAGDEG